MIVGAFRIAYQRIIDADAVFADLRIGAGIEGDPFIILADIGNPIGACFAAFGAGIGGGIDGFIDADAV